VLTDPRRIAVIVTVGDAERLLEVARTLGEAARSGAAVRVFFRDESLPAICTPEIASRLMPAASAGSDANSVHAALQELASAGDVRLYACSSSLYIWGIDSRDLIPALAGARGLIAFLAEDLAGASEVLTY
jgi:peroxiredoxin family protein